MTERDLQFLILVLVVFMFIQTARVAYWKARVEGDCNLSDMLLQRHHEELEHSRALVKRLMDEREARDGGEPDEGV